MARIRWQCNHTVIKCHKVSYLRAMGDILTFPVWEVLWEVHVPVDLVEPPSAVHRRPGWDEQVQEVHLQILLIKLPRKGSFAVLCALTTFTFYFYLQTHFHFFSWIHRQHERIHTGEKPWKCDQCSERFQYRLKSIAILRIIRELLLSGIDGKHTSESALVASLSPASLKRWALLSVMTNWRSVQPQCCKYDSKGQCL